MHHRQRTAYNRADLDKLIETNLCSKGNLSNANLSGANLKRADLSAANLSKANFTEANLSKADLTDADLTGACFKNTTMPNGEKYTGLGEDYKGPLRVGISQVPTSSPHTDYPTPITSKDDAANFLNGLLGSKKPASESDSDETD